MSMITTTSPEGPCTADDDCPNQPNTECLQGECHCLPDFMGDSCQHENPCNPNPCLNEGQCVPVPEDGSFYCDCVEGYAHPLCEPQDPCDLEGKQACLNGATCSKLSPYDYVCQCRVPYVGEFCESYNLCDIDQEQCIEDVNVAGSQVPVKGGGGRMESVCFPCVRGSNCTQISVHEYFCSCEAGINHTHCVREVHGQSGGGSIKIPAPDKFPDRDPLSDWNPVVPSIALGFCALYLVIMLFGFLVMKRRGKQKPKLIVGCDIQEFDQLAFYLISVETDTNWGAGTDCYVYCFLCGENGDVGPFPLNDANLKGLNVLQRAQEDNYLISHITDLGQITKLVICYDNKHQTFTDWSCSRVTVKNIKTGDNWFFFMSSDIKPQSTVAIYEFFPATPNFIAEWNKVSVDCRHYGREVTRYHTYISPFIYPTAERITLMFAEVMSYMFWLICWFGALENPDADIKGPLRKYELHPSVIFTESLISAALGCLVGMSFDILFEFSRVTRIPTLVVWKNRTGLTGLGSKDDLTDSYEEEEVGVGNTYRLCFDKATNTDPFVPPPKRIKKRREIPIPPPAPPPPPVAHAFRIPSTNISNLERWIYDNVKGTSGPEELEEEDLIHDSTTFQDKMPVFPGDSNSDLPIPSTATTNEGESPPTFGPSSYELVETELSDEDGVTVSELAFKRNQHEPQRFPVLKPESIFAGGDSIQNSVIKMKMSRSRTSRKPTRNYYELVEMEHKNSGSRFDKQFCELSGWLLCSGTILLATLICCMYGGRYGYNRSWDWIASFSFCLLQNFFLCQFIKILVMVVVVTIMVNEQNLSTFEEEKIRQRFQLYHLDTDAGLTELPETFKMKHVMYLPKHWIPPPEYVKLPANPDMNNLINSEVDMSYQNQNYFYNNN